MSPRTRGLRWPDNDACARVAPVEIDIASELLSSALLNTHPSPHDYGKFGGRRICGVFGITKTEEAQERLGKSALPLSG